MTPARFENELVKAEWETAPNGAELGATFRGFNHHPDLGWSWEVVCVINRYEEGRLFGWSAGEGERGRPVVVHRCGRRRPHPPVVPLDDGARPIRAHPGDRSPTRPRG